MRRFKHLAAVAVAVVALALLSGCSLPPATVLVQAATNPLVGEQRFAVAPVTFATPLRVGVKTEADYLVNKSADAVKTWDESKNAFGAAFTGALVAQGQWDPAGVYTVRPSVLFVEPGYNVGVWYKFAEVEVEVAITDSAGKLIDRIAMRPVAGDYTVTQRLTTCGRSAGEMVSRYLHKRTGR